MINNHRYQYYAKAINISLNDNSDRLINLGLSKYLSGVQSFSSSLSINPIDMGDIDFNISNSRNNCDINLERYIRKSGDFFITQSNSIINELFKNKGLAIPFNIIAIYGNENEGRVLSGNVNYTYVYKNFRITSLRYDMSIRGPGIKESIGWIGTDIYVDQNPQLQFPNAAENVDLFHREDFIPIFSPSNHSILPDLVHDLINHHTGLDEHYMGLQDISISIDIPYTELVDEGTWNLNNANKYYLVNVPILIETIFTLNTKRGTLDKYFNSSPDRDNNTIKLNYGNFQFNMGDNNRLISMSTKGGDTDGSIETLDITYNNFNAFKIQGL